MSTGALVRVGLVEALGHFEDDSGPPEVGIGRHRGFGVAVTDLGPRAQGEGQRFHHRLAGQLGLLSEGADRLSQSAVIRH